MLNYAVRYCDALLGEDARRGDCIVSLLGGGHVACGEWELINGATELASA